MYFGWDGHYFLIYYAFIDYFFTFNPFSSLEHQITCPPDLEHLYELYKEEQNQPLIKGDDLSSFSSFEKVS